MQRQSLEEYRGKVVHFIGIGGSSMSGLALLLRGAGCVVRGDDRSESHATHKLRQAGIPVTIGHDAQNVRGADLVVYTAAIAPDNVERVACGEWNIPQMERAELLGLLADGHEPSIAVSGTHGKTTLTSMLATALLEAGRDPTIHIGGELDRIGGNVHAGTDGSFLTEACEFKASFLTLHPTLAIVTNVDADHLDFYRDLDEIEDTFAKFLGGMREGGTAVLCADSPRALHLKDRVPVRCVTYGLDNPAADWRAEDLQHDEALCYAFVPVRGEERLPRVALAVPGRHNAENALGATAALHELGFSGEEIARGLAAFAGAHRRFERTGTVQGVALYHDYGHNPAEFATVVPLGKAAAGAHRLFAVCQPHTYSRTKALFDQYLTCWDGADEVLVTDIYAAREKDPGDIHATMLVKALQEAGVPAVYTPDFDACEAYLRAHWAPGDAVLTLGCGNINLLNEQIQRHEADKTGERVE